MGHEQSQAAAAHPPRARTKGRPMSGRKREQAEQAPYGASVHRNNTVFSLAFCDQSEFRSSRRHQSHTNLCSVALEAPLASKFEPCAALFLHFKGQNATSARKIDMLSAMQSKIPDCVHRYNWNLVLQLSSHSPLGHSSRDTTTNAAAASPAAASSTLASHRVGQLLKPCIVATVRVDETVLHMAY